MILLRRLSLVLLTVATILALAPQSSQAHHRNPVVDGRHFRFNAVETDVVTVTFTEPLPISSGDYISVKIKGVPFGGPPTNDNQLSIPFLSTPYTLDPGGEDIVIGLGIYGTVAHNGVIQTPIDSEIAQDFTYGFTVEPFSNGTLLRLKPTFRLIDPDAEAWITMRYKVAPILNQQLTPGEKAAIQSQLDSVTDVAFINKHIHNPSQEEIITLPCQDKSFYIDYMPGFGPGFVTIKRQQVDCPSS